MSDKKPRFSVGDRVLERFPLADANREIGTVINRYQFEVEFRYVVKFESGREEVFFERELLSVSQSQQLN